MSQERIDVNPAESVNPEAQGEQLPVVVYLGNVATLTLGLQNNGPADHAGPETGYRLFDDDLGPTS